MAKIKIITQVANGKKRSLTREITTAPDHVWSPTNGVKKKAAKKRRPVSESPLYSFKKY